nr:MAG TPA: hypothetical protein [Crassvirales sp.]
MINDNNAGLDKAGVFYCVKDKNGRDGEADKADKIKND